MFLWCGVIWKMGWVEYVSKTKLSVIDNTIVLIKSLHILAQKITTTEYVIWDYNPSSDNCIILFH